MTCTKCTGDTGVIATIKGFYVTRFRQCKKCGHTFKTFEIVTVSHSPFDEEIRDISLQMAKKEGLK